MFAGLTPNTVYYFNLFTYDTWGFNTSSASEISTTTLAALPTALSSSGITQTAATISWLANDNPDGTEYYAENSNNESMNSGGWITTQTHTFDNLSCGTSYSFHVKARNSAGVETVDWSIELGVSTSACDTQGGGAIPPGDNPPTPPPPIDLPLFEPCDPTLDPSCICNPYTDVCTPE
ncbi:MAG: fibronectin type III domain-containing protein, partial [Candidatus Magasanikbacteria bacterium]|nr:fibronectin type III domain-containing protein [Candidatus Magasanikbacteria bacterium]